MITTTSELKELVQLLENEKYIGLDTEFHWRSTYYPKLCLIQLATDRACFIIDPLSKDIDLTVLKPLLENENITKILHACSQDIKIINFELNAKINPIFDTQLAGEFLGLSHQGSLQKLLEALEIATLEKSQTMTDWRKRPLTNKQLQYANDDVKHLVQTHIKLKYLLAKESKLEWIEEDLEHLTHNHENFTYTEPELAYKKIGSYKRLDPRGRFILKNLSFWRESIAQQKNISQQWIISNKSIIEIAKRKPNSALELKHYSFLLNTKQLEYYSNKIIEILETSKQIQHENNPQDKQPIVTTEAIKEVTKKLAEICKKYNIVPQTVAPKQEIKRFLMEGNNASLLSKGWRYEHFGKHLEA
jgi:ribonuclease D